METREMSDFEQRAMQRMLDAEADARDRADFMHRRGYQRCDIPACNCGSWHGGNAENRLREIYDALGELVDGKLPVPVIEELISENERLRAAAMGSLSLPGRWQLG